LDLRARISGSAPYVYPLSGFLASQLPRQVETLAVDNTAGVLSWLLAGGVVEGLAIVAAGTLGDRWLERFGSCRRLIAIGTALLFLAYMGFARASDIVGLIDNCGRSRSPS